MTIAAPERTCAGCTTSLAGRSPRAKWCSDPCRTRFWRAQNPEKMSASAIAWKKAHPEANRAVARRAYAKNPETAKRSARARRAREAGAETLEFTERDWLRLVARYRGRCAYCGKRPDTLHREHIIPLARGGRHSVGNILPACPTCNLRKKTKLLAEFRYRLTSGRG